MVNPLVSICCITFNHEPYIRDCLEGFVTQKTDFPFEVLIHDDASGDRTADIIREYEAQYPEIIKPIYQTENQYSKGVMVGETFNFPRARGEYIAVCEGDDYWNSPYKLQKQIDLFREHPEYAMVYCDYNIRDEISGVQIKSVIESQAPAEIRQSARCLSLQAVVSGKCRIASASCMCRREVFTAPVAPLDNFRGSSLSDLFFKIDSAIYGGIGYIPEAMTTYRMISGSATHTGNSVKAMKFEWDALKIRDFYCEHCDLSSEVAKNIRVDAFRRMARIALSLYSPDDIGKIRSQAAKYGIKFTPAQKIMLMCGENHMLNCFSRNAISLLKMIRERIRKSKTEKM